MASWAGMRFIWCSQGTLTSFPPTWLVSDSAELPPAREVSGPAAAPPTAFEVSGPAAAPETDFEVSGPAAAPGTDFEVSGPAGAPRTTFEVSGAGEAGIAGPARAVSRRALKEWALPRPAERRIRPLPRLIVSPAAGAGLPESAPAPAAAAGGGAGEDGFEESGDA